MTFPKQKLKKTPVFLRGNKKNEDIFQEGPEGFVSLSLPSLCRDWVGAFGGKQWRCQQRVSAGGHVERGASLNVREWIREPDCAWEVRAEEKKKEICSMPLCMCECLSMSTCAFTQAAHGCSCSRVHEWKCASRSLKQQRLWGRFLFPLQN